MEHLYAFLLLLFPEGFDPMAMASVYAFIAIAILAVGGIARVASKGKGSAFSHALSSSVAVLVVYTVFAIIYRLDPKIMASIIELLPMFSLKDGIVTLFDFSAAGLTAVCAELLHIYILVFMVIMLDDMIPDVKNVPSWFVLQFIITAVATLCYWLFVHFVNAYIPGLLDNYAPLVLVSILVFMMGLALLNAILGLMLTAINPLLGAVYTFFFSTKFGKALSKAALSTVLLCALVIFVKSLGYISFAIVGGTLLPFLLFLILLMLLWYLLGYFL